MEVLRLLLTKELRKIRGGRGVLAASGQDDLTTASGWAGAERAKEQTDRARMRYSTKVRERQVALKQLRAQALALNRRGDARTSDHLLMTSVDDNLLPRKMRARRRNTGPSGRGAKWKAWTPECICKAAFADTHASCQAKTPTGGSKSHTMKCNWVVANVIAKGQTGCVRGVKRNLAAASAAASGQVDFFISNNMFDETQLWVKGVGRTAGKKAKAHFSGLWPGDLPRNWRKYL